MSSMIAADYTTGPVSARLLLRPASYAARPRAGSGCTGRFSGCQRKRKFGARSARNGCILREARIARLGWLDLFSGKGVQGMRTIHILGILVLLALAVPAAPAHTGGVVSVCDEAHLLTALAGGIYLYAVTATLKNTIVANNRPGGNCRGNTINGGSGNLRAVTVISGRWNSSHTEQYGCPVDALSESAAMDGAQRIARTPVYPKPMPICRLSAIAADWLHSRNSAPLPSRREHTDRRASDGNAYS